MREILYLRGVFWWVLGGCSSSSFKTGQKLLFPFQSFFLGLPLTFLGFLGFLGVPRPLLGLGWTSNGRVELLGTKEPPPPSSFTPPCNSPADNCASDVSSCRILGSSNSIASVSTFIKQSTRLFEELREKAGDIWSGPKGSGAGLPVPQERSRALLNSSATVTLCQS